METYTLLQYIMRRYAKTHYSHLVQRLAIVALAISVVGCEDFSNSGYRQIDTLSLSVCAERLDDGDVRVSAADPEVLQGCLPASDPGENGLRFTRGDRMIASSNAVEQELYRRERPIIYRTQFDATGDGLPTTAVDVRFERDNLPPAVTPSYQLDVPQLPSFTVRQDGMRVDRNEPVNIDWQASVSGGNSTASLLVQSENCGYENEFSSLSDYPALIDLVSQNGSASLQLADAIGLQFTRTECTVHIGFRLGQRRILEADTPFDKLVLDAQALAPTTATITFVNSGAVQ